MRLASLSNVRKVIGLAICGCVWLCVPGRAACPLVALVESDTASALAFTDQQILRFQTADVDRRIQAAEALIGLARSSRAEVYDLVVGRVAHALKNSDAHVRVGAGEFFYLLNDGSRAVPPLLEALRTVDRTVARQEGQPGGKSRGLSEAGWERNIYLRALRQYVSSEEVLKILRANRGGP